MRKFSRVYCQLPSTAVVEVCAENPQRTGLFLQNNDDAEIINVYLLDHAFHKEETIYIYPHSWIYLDQDDDCHKQWHAATPVTGGPAWLSVVEFFKEVTPKQVAWWPFL